MIYASVTGRQEQTWLLMAENIFECIFLKTNTAWFCYNMVSILQNTHSRDPITCLWGQDMQHHSIIQNTHSRDPITCLWGGKICSIFCKFKVWLVFHYGAVLYVMSSYSGPYYNIIQLYLFFREICLIIFIIQHIKSFDCLNNGLGAEKVKVIAQTTDAAELCCNNGM